MSRLHNITDTLVLCAQYGSTDNIPVKSRRAPKFSQKLRTHILVQELDPKHSATHLSGIVKHSYFHATHTRIMHAIQVKGGQKDIKEGRVRACVRMCVRVC